MATDIKCPVVGHKFAIEDAVSEDIKKRTAREDANLLKTEEDDFAKRETILIQQVQHKDAMKYAKKAAGRNDKASTDTSK